MTEKEAIEETRILGDLFPRTSDTNLNLWLKIFTGYEREITRKAIVQYAEDGDEFIDRTKLRAMLENLSGRGPERNPEKRLASAESAAAARTAALVEQQAKVSASLAAVDLSLDGLSDVDLEALKQKAQAEAPEDLWPFLRRSDPKRSVVLRYMMAQHVASFVRP